jgi:hypothetical protein
MKYIAVAFIMFSLTSCAPRTIPSDKLKGEWLNKELVDTLLATRSTYKATTAIMISNIEITNSGIIGLNKFHDSFGRGIDKLCLTNKPFVYTIKGKKQDTIFILDRDSCNKIMFSFYNHNVFIRINEPIDKLINKTVIVGKYRDGSGKVYFFEPDGSTNWPKQGYKYHVVKDFWPIEKDCIIFSDTLNNKEHYYGYSWKDNILRFHDETNYPENTSDDYKDFKKESVVELLEIKP